MPRLLTLVACCTLAAAAPGLASTPEQTLKYEPVQPGIDYTKPSKAEIANCTVKLEKAGNAWVVLDPRGQVLRRFGDSNGDKLVDTWSYFKAGVEVYRDIDSNFDQKPDQYRWFHTGGSRWGRDPNADGSIDSWKAISAYEVGEELVRAIASRETKAFARLLLSKKELAALGAGRTVTAQFTRSLQDSPSGFRELLASQKAISKETRFVDFGAGRPGAIPAGADGATKDVLIYQGASILVETGGESEQVQLGTLVKVGDAWRLVAAPQIGSQGVELANVFSLSSASSGSGLESAPTARMQKLMAELESIDKRLASAGGDARLKLVQSRARMLRELASMTTDRKIRQQWQSDLADMLAAAAVEGVYEGAIKDLRSLLTELDKSKADPELIAHVRFQLIWSEWGVRSRDSKQDYTKVQAAWLKQLRAFATAYPNSADTAEALLQLGMAAEFDGQLEEAEEWYGKLADDFPSTSRGKKARGAIARLKSIGKTIDVRASALGGGSVSLRDYRGKVVLIQYWATWCEPCKADMAQLKRLNARYGGNGFAVLGVCLDSQATQAQRWLKENPTPWKHAYDTDGLDGRLAQEMGVMTLPLMILVDDSGKVIRRSLHIAELDSELRQVLR